MLLGGEYKLIDTQLHFTSLVSRQMPQDLRTSERVLNQLVVVFRLE
jgi:hypothetical protein